MLTVREQRRGKQRPKALEIRKTAVELHAPLILSSASSAKPPINHILFCDALVQEDIYSEGKYEGIQLQRLQEGNRH